MRETVVQLLMVDDETKTITNVSWSDVSEENAGQISLMLGAPTVSGSMPIDTAVQAAVGLYQEEGVTFDDFS